MLYKSSYSFIHSTSFLSFTLYPVTQPLRVSRPSIGRYSDYFHSAYSRWNQLIIVAERQCSVADAFGLERHSATAASYVSSCNNSALLGLAAEKLAG